MADFIKPRGNAFTFEGHIRRKQALEKALNEQFHASIASPAEIRADSDSSRDLRGNAAQEPDGEMRDPGHSQAQVTDSPKPVIEGVTAQDGE